MQPVMIHPKEEGTTATIKPVLMNPVPQIPDQSQQVGHRKAQAHQLLALPETARTGTAPHDPLATARWVTAHHVLLGIVHSAIDHHDRPVIGHTPIAHHVPLEIVLPATVNHLATVHIPHVLQANAHR